MRRPRRRPGRPAHRRQRHQRRRARGGDDHRGAAQHDLRRLAGARRPRRAWCSTRSTTSRTPTGARCGRRSSSTCPADVRLVCLSATVSNADELAEWISDGARARPRRSIEERAAGRAGEPLPGRRQVEPSASHLLPDPGRRPAQPRGRPPRRRRRARPARRPAARQARRRLLHAPAGRGGRAARPSGTAAGDLLHLQPQRRATTRPQPCLDAGLRLTTAGRAATASGRSPRTALGAPDRRATSTCSATTAGSPGSRPASPPTTPAWCRRSRRRSRRASSRAWSRWCSPPRPSPLGINMPARSVVIEKLSKFTGEHHEFLTPGEYTQLTGRAGRRGIDTSATPSCCGRPFVPFDQVAALASSRAFALTLGVPAHLQHGRQPGAPLPGRGGPPPAEPVLRPVPGRPRRGAPRDPAGAPPAAAGRPAGRGHVRARRRHRRVPGARARRSAGPTPAGGRRPAAGAAMDDGAGAAAARRRDRARPRPPRRPGGGAHASPTARAGRAAAGDHHRPAAGAAVGASDFDEPPRPVGHIDLPDAVRPATARASSARWPAPLRAGHGWRRADAAARATPRRLARAEAAADHPVAACPDLAAHLAGRRPGRAAGAARSPTSTRSGSRAAASRWPAGSTACCGCSRRGATSTAGR